MSESRITKEWLKKFLRKEHRLYYSTPELNDCLYLHYKGFRQIENLDEFTGLKVLYMEGNGITVLENLENNVNLRCLYLQENCIKDMQNLDKLTELGNLNLTDNMIERISGLSECKKLTSLALKRNRIGFEGIDDLRGLLECPSITSLDLTDNKIADPEILPEILQKMPNLAVLYLHNNEVCKKIQHYRKTIITALPNLKYLDDRPVFEDERRYCEAFASGGLEAEREERKKYKQEQADAHKKNHDAVTAMLAQARADYLAQQQAQAENQQQSQQNQENQQNRNNDSSIEIQNDSQTENQTLSTYNTPLDSKQDSQQQSNLNSEPSNLNSEQSRDQSEQQNSETSREMKASLSDISKQNSQTQSDTEDALDLEIKPSNLQQFLGSTLDELD